MPATKRSNVAIICRLPWAIACLVLTTLALAACNDATLQRAFSADPNANRWGSLGQAQVQLPQDFPAELRFAEARLTAVTPGAHSGPGPATSAWTQTRWMTPESNQAVLVFYQQRFQTEGWRLLRQVTGDGQTTLTAQNQDLQVLVAIPATDSPSPQPSLQPGTNPGPDAGNRMETAFVLEYVRGLKAAAVPPEQNGETPAQPGDPGFVEPIASPQAGEIAAVAAAPLTPRQFLDLDQAPPEFQSYLRDLAQLGVLTPASASGDQFKPNQVINRRTFARWLVVTNNRIYRDRPGRQIRLATASTPATFRDLPPTDPDFPYIQGLAEAGYLPSALSGDNTALQFRPDAPLTRENLLQWKVPVDLRQILPTATATSVQQVWGFKDANRIDPQVLQAVLADHQNGDLSNIRRLLGATLLLQPQKAVTRAQAATALWYIGIQGDGLSAQDVARGERQAQGVTVNPSP